MPARERRSGVTKYDRAHQLERERWAPTVAAGQAYCAEIRCLKPSRWIPPGTSWDLAHDRANGGYLGPAHSLCNRSEGAKFGNSKRPKSTRPAQKRTPGQPTPRQQRTCVMCGKRYTPSYHGQRCCSRACGVELKRHGPRLNLEASLPTARRCSECGTSFTPAHARHYTCSSPCSRRRSTRKAGERYRTDPHYAAERRAAQLAWHERNPGYAQAYKNGYRKRATANWQQG